EAEANAGRDKQRRVAARDVRSAEAWYRRSERGRDWYFGVDAEQWHAGDAASVAALHRPGSAEVQRVGSGKVAAEGQSDIILRPVIFTKLAECQRRNQQQ